MARVFKLKRPLLILNHIWQEGYEAFEPLEDEMIDIEAQLIMELKEWIKD